MRLPSCVELYKFGAKSIHLLHSHRSENMSYNGQFCQNEYALEHVAALPYQVKTQYLQTLSIIDTSIKNFRSIHSHSMDICLIWKILLLVTEEQWSSAKFVQESFKVKESSLRDIWNADIAFLLGGAELCFSNHNHNISVDRISECIIPSIIMSLKTFKA